MRLTLQITSGLASGRRIDLRDGQIARFGRTDWADFSFQDDAAMADLHFSVQCAPGGAVIRSLSADRETLVNGDAIESTALQAGDRITAGRTSFVVLTGDIMPGPAADELPESGGHEDAAVENELPATCEHLDFDDTVTALAVGAASWEEVTQRLIEANQLNCAIRWVAHHLEKRESVWWGCECVRATPTSSWTARELAAFEAAERWATEPSEATRRATEKAAEAAKYDGAGATLALAAFWSGGSIAPPDSPEVIPDDRLTGQAVAGALTIASVAGVGADPTERLREFLQRAEKVQVPDAHGLV